MRNTRYLSLSFILLIPCGVSHADDWPTYRHGVQRNAVTAEQPPIDSLAAAWVWRSHAPPQPAWFGPAKWDAYANLKGLRSMRNYDPVFHLVAVGDRVWFGSSADDAVHCLDARSGREVWRFTTDAPVRIAPTVFNDNVYFGSDDGSAYCVAAEDGGLVWSHAPTTTDRRILNNGRLISPWPCRTGVLVDGGTAYFACGLLPWKESYLCAVDAATGRVEGPGRFEQRFENRTMEGPLVATQQRILVPQGRVAPALFDRASGQSLGSLPGGGGCFVVATEEGHVLHGPGNKAGWITESDAQSRESIATIGGANAMVVAGGMAYVLRDDRIEAVQRGDGQVVWSVPCDCPYDLILAGETLLVGGRDKVIGLAAGDGSTVWQGRVQGRAYGLAVANGKLYATTDEGTIHAFASIATMESEAPVVVKSSEPALPALAVPPFEDDDLLGRWVFQGEGLQGTVVKDQVGSLDGAISGPIELKRLGDDAEALALDGQRQHVLLSDKPLAAEPVAAALPSREMTAEAWVRVDQPLTWGGIIGCVQDNGAYERGWLLGYNGSRFSLAVSTKDGPGGLTYLQADADFQPGEGYHVVGTYDGAEMRVYVNGRLVAQSSAQQGEINYPPQAFYTIGAYRDNDEFFRLTGCIHEVRLYGRALSEKEVRSHYESQQLDWPTQPTPGETLTLAVGPWLQFTDPTSAVVRWHTAQPSPTILDFEIEGETLRLEESNATTSHEVTLENLRKNMVYHYTIKQLVDGEEQSTARFECDTFFNYTRPAVPPAAGPATDALSWQAPLNWAHENLSEGGLAVLIGFQNTRLAHELAVESGVRIICVDTDKEVVTAAREALADAGVYGNWITAHHVESYDRLPFVGRFADFVTCSQSVPRPNRGLLWRPEMMRLLRPGAMAVFNPLGKGYAPVWLVVPNNERQPNGAWTHQYGLADNSAYGGEPLEGVRSTDDLDVQWIGRPGPRAQADRNGRKPSPLAVDGRLFMQGLERIIALNAYNGTVLWSLEIPDFQRFNIPRDSSNWCAPGDVFAVVRDKCWRIDAANGQVTQRYDVVSPVANDDAARTYDWGFVACPGGQLLLGTAVRSGTSWTGFWGGEGWYDSKSGPVTDKICGESLFTIDPNTGETDWTYTNGLVLHPTITIKDERIYFVECRNEKVVQSESRRVGMPELWLDQFLVALDLTSGEKVWEKPLDTADGLVVFYMAAADDKLVVVSSERKYHVYAFDSADGSPVWHNEFDWPKDNHGGHMSRPAIVGEKVFVRPRVLDLNSGEFLDIPMPVGGCGTYAATDNALIFRNSNITVWDADSGKATSWSRLRPGCWLSTIPACGMLLAPEAGGGCSCGSWLETSIGFAPVDRD